VGDEGSSQENLIQLLQSLKTHQSAVSAWTTTVDIEFAKRLWVGIGDSVEFSVQWRKTTLTVSWLRKAERSWATPFFYFRFDPVEFMEAPRTFFRSVIVDKENKDTLQRWLIDSLGKHLSFVDWVGNDWKSCRDSVWYRNVLRCVRWCYGEEE